MNDPGASFGVSFVRNLAPDERLTYRHYRTWPDSESWELIDGHAWAMSPAPTRSHQRFVDKLHASIDRYLIGKPRQAYLAPFNVLLLLEREADDDSAAREKFGLYQRHGVREYWVVDPAGEWLCVYRLSTAGAYDEGELREPLWAYGPIASKVLEGFIVNPKELFAGLD